MRKELLKTVLLLITLTILLSSCKGSGSDGDNSSDPVVVVDNTGDVVNEETTKEPALAPEELIRKYYSLMSNRDTLKEAYELSTKKVDYEKFYSWYKDVKEVNVGEIESLGDDRYRFDIIMLEYPFRGNIKTYYFEVTMKLGNSRIIESDSKSLTDVSPTSKEIIIIDTSRSPFDYFKNEMSDEDAPVIRVDGEEYYLLGEGEGKEILIERKKPYEINYFNTMVKNVGNKLFLRDKSTNEITFFCKTEALDGETSNFVCKQNSAYYVMNKVITIKYDKEQQLDGAIKVSKSLVSFTKSEAPYTFLSNSNILYLKGISRDRKELIGIQDGNTFVISILESGYNKLFESSYTAKIFGETEYFIYDYIMWSSPSSSDYNNIWLSTFKNGIIQKLAKVNSSEYNNYNIAQLKLTQHDYLLNPDYGILFFSEFSEKDKRYNLFLYNLIDEEIKQISESVLPFKPYFKDRDTLMYFSPEVDGFVEYKMPVIN